MFLRSMMAVITTVLVVIASSTFPGFAIDGTAKTQIPGVYPFKLGDFTITALSDGTVPQDLPKLLTHTNPVEIDRLLQRSFLTNPVEASIKAISEKENTSLSWAN